MRGALSAPLIQKSSLKSATLEISKEDNSVLHTLGMNFFEGALSALSKKIHA